MGNCFVLENKVIKIVRTDGKVLEYRGPMKVHQILSQFSGHTLSDALSNTDHHLQPDAKLLAGRLYYLIPLPLPSPKPKNKEVRFANPEVEEQEQEKVIDREGGDNNVSVVRIKIVLSKQELQKLIQGGSIHDMVYQSLDKQELIGNPMGECDNGDLECKRGWKPELDSILE